MVEHSISGEKHSTASRVFPYTSFVLYRFLGALQQNRGQSRLLYLLIKGNPRSDFLMVIMASGIARGRVRTTATTVESCKRAAVLQIIGTVKK